MAHPCTLEQRLAPLLDLIDLENCPTCHESLTPRGIPARPIERCGMPDPSTLGDVEPVRCQLPSNHRSEEHWHASLWPGTPSLLWVQQ